MGPVQNPNTLTFELKIIHCPDLKIETNIEFNYTVLILLHKDWLSVNSCSAGRHVKAEMINIRKKEEEIEYKTKNKTDV